MFCKYCGKDIDVKSKKCPHCGEETSFLTGIDGSEKPEALEAFEEDLNRVIGGGNSKQSDNNEEYQDISSYGTGTIEVSDHIDNNVVDRPLKEKAPERRKQKQYEEYEESSKAWKVLAVICAVVIVISLIIIFAVSCSSNSSSSDVATTTVNTTPITQTETTTVEETTTVPTTEKSIDDYLSDAVVDDETATETAQGFYSNIESACASGDYDTFKSYFTSSYTEEEIKNIYDQYQSTCSSYGTFIVGITQTVSCDKYIYVYIAATTDLDTGDYVENTFVLGTDGSAFKLDKSDGASAWLNQAPTKLY
jgi:hypothetical protein